MLSQKIASAFSQIKPLLMTILCSLVMAVCFVGFRYSIGLEGHAYDAPTRYSFCAMITAATILAFVKKIGKILYACIVVLIAVITFLLSM